MSEPTKAAGYEARIMINGTLYGVRNFRDNRKVDTQEVGDSEDGRFKRTKALRKECRMSFTAIADPNLVPNLILGVYEGAYVPILYYPFGVDDVFDDFPDVCIDDVGDQHDVNGMVEINFSGVTNGPYILRGEETARDGGAAA